MTESWDACTNTYEIRDTRELDMKEDMTFTDAVLLHGMGQHKKTGHAFVCVRGDLLYKRTDARTAGAVAGSTTLGTSKRR